jgi:hypothetical protein
MQVAVGCVQSSHIKHLNKQYILSCREQKFKTEKLFTSITDVVNQRAGFFAQRRLFRKAVRCRVVST